MQSVMGTGASCPFLPKTHCNLHRGAVRQGGANGRDHSSLLVSLLRCMLQLHKISQAATHQALSPAARYNRGRVVPPLECLVPRVAVGHRRVKRPYLTAFVSSASVWSTSACDGSDRQSKKNRPGWSHRLCQSLLLYMQGHANFPVLRLNFDSWRKRCSLRPWVRPGPKKPSQPQG